MPWKSPRVLKSELTARFVFIEAVTKRLLELGASRVLAPYGKVYPPTFDRRAKRDAMKEQLRAAEGAEWTIMTVIGPLRVTPFDTWVACGFTNYDAAKARFGHWKWNHHYRAFVTEVRAFECAEDFARKLRGILPPAT